MLSVMILTKNNADTVRESLASVQWAEQIVVVDSGSTDDTLSICQEYGAEVYVHKNWLGFGAQRNRALTYCKQPWVLVLDSDEVVTEELREEMLAFMQNSGQYSAAQMKRLTYFLGQPVRFSSWNKPVKRLFKRAQGRYDDNAIVHESLLVHGDIAKLKGVIEHYSYLSLEQTLQKINAYSTAAAEKKFKQGRRASFSRAIFSGLWSFIKNYLLQAGFLDGKTGYMVARINAQESYYRYLKLWQLSQQVKS